MYEENKIKYNVTEKSIQDLVNLYDKGLLELSPGFQRQSVWQENDRARLIVSILRHYPMPAIFLYDKKNGDGEIIYEVIDGKQRLESIFKFMGVLKGKLKGQFSIPKGKKVNAEVHEQVDWKQLKKQKKQDQITGYKMPVIEVGGDLSDIINLFELINTTGKPLTPQEKKKAQFHDRPFLNHAAKIANNFEDYFRKNKIFSAPQISRMKHVELVCEVMLALMRGAVQEKKAVLHEMKLKTETEEFKKASKITRTTFKRIKEMFPKLNSETRFTKISDFYTLAVLIGQYESQGLVLKDQKKNEEAWAFLQKFAYEVDNVANKKNDTIVHEDKSIYNRYHQTVLSSTDSLSNRKERGEILDDLLRSIFDSKDKKRGFTEVQRRIVWNSSKNKRCAHKGKDCRPEILTFENFEIDHIKPFSKGGKTTLENARLMCKHHNASRGNREVA